MKAVILAGGLGSRLRPLSLKRPKPMIPLLDQPLLTHTLHRLEAAGVTEAVLTLKYLPEQISSHFAQYTGMKLHFRVEQEAMGTAGAVRACEDLLAGPEPFLVVSGDAVWDLDLPQALALHRQRRPLATLLLYASPEPLEYGQVRLSSDGSIAAFSEKPAWSRVYTDLVNTGIYILSPEILNHIPEHVPYDFAKDLFPQLLAKGRRLLGHQARGYWCDVGSCAAYHRCSMDALAGRISFLGPAVESQLPAGVVVCQPVFIGPGVQAEPGAVLGPNAVLAGGSRVEAGARIRDSVVFASSIGREAELRGSLVLGASVGEGAALRPGSVIADGARVGGGATVQENVRVFPGQALPEGFLLSRDLVSTLPAPRPAFQESCLPDCPDLPQAMALGAAAGSFSRAGAAWAEDSALFARSFLCGVQGAGAEAMALDAEFASAAAFAARLYGLPLLAFFDRGARPALHFFNAEGLPISRETERKLETALDAPDYASKPGPIKVRSGVMEAYVAAAIRCRLAPAPIPVAVGGSGPLARALKQALKLSGCRITEPGPGILCLGAAQGGFALRARDENGRHIPASRLLVLLAALELGASGRAAVPDDAPALLDKLAAQLGAVLLRPARDGEKARALYVRSPFFRDGIFAAVRLVSHLARDGKTLAAALAAVPDFARLRRELPLHRGRAEVMGALTRAWAQEDLDLSHGFCLQEKGFCARIRPLAEKRALRLEVEGGSMEAAEEFLQELEGRIHDLDQG